MVRISIYFTLLTMHDFMVNCILLFALTLYAFNIAFPCFTEQVFDQPFENHSTSTTYNKIRTDPF